jgi:hypothetical protein
MDKTFMSIIVLATAFYFINKPDNSCAKQTGQHHVLMTGSVGAGFSRREPNEVRLL